MISTMACEKKSRVGLLSSVPTNSVGYRFHNDKLITHLKFGYTQALGLNLREYSSAAG